MFYKRLLGIVFFGVLVSISSVDAEKKAKQDSVF